MEIERRALTGLELRAADGQTKIVGYAAVFNSMSEDLGFREIIMPGAFDRALRESQDVRALVNHDPNQILGRTKSGTLALSIDERGLRAEITPPDTAAARDVLTSIKRGDLDGMSFGFTTVTDNWRTEEGQQIRELMDLNLLDVSVVAFPAYGATQVSARALLHARVLGGDKRSALAMGTEAKLRALLATIEVAGENIDVAVDSIEALLGISDEETEPSPEPEPTPEPAPRPIEATPQPGPDPQGDQALASDNNSIRRARLRLAE